MERRGAPSGEGGSISCSRLVGQGRSGRGAGDAVSYRAGQVGGAGGGGQAGRGQQEESAPSEPQWVASCSTANQRDSLRGTPSAANIHSPTHLLPTLYLVPGTFPNPGGSSTQLPIPFTLFHTTHLPLPAHLVPNARPHPAGSCVQLSRQLAACALVVGAPGVEGAGGGPVATAGNVLQGGRRARGMVRRSPPGIAPTTLHSPRSALIIT